MLNVATHLPTYGEYIVKLKSTELSSQSYKLKSRWKTPCKQKMKRKEAFLYYNEKLRRCFDASSKNCT